MEIKNLLILSLLMVVVPLLIGTIWGGLLKIDHKIKYIAFSWLTGFLTMMAMAQVIAVPMVLRRKHFHPFQCVYTAALVILCVLALVFLLYQWKKKIAWAEHEKMNWTTILFVLGAVFLIGIQTYFVSAYQHIDDDDSRFVVEEVMAVERNAMYILNPVTGALSFWDMGEVRKDMTSPWTMFVAYISKMSDIPPAVLSHRYLPIFLIPMCYVVYAMIGLFFFQNNREKTGIFLIFISALQMYGYSSTHTISALMLLRIWQGKALVASLFIPLMFYLMCELQEKNEKKMWYAVTALTGLAGALASGIGITSLPVVIGVGGIVNLFHRGGVAKTVKIWCTAIPSVVCLLCYLFFWQLLKVYF